MESGPETIGRSPKRVLFTVKPLIHSLTDGENSSGSEMDVPSPGELKVSQQAKGNKRSPNKLPNPGFRTRVSRDTLNGRLRKRKGKPGSRKNHRWENEKRLGRREDELSDTGPSTDDEMNKYLFEQSSQNIFYRIFEEPELYENFKPFLDITPEEEEYLKNLNDDDDSDSFEDNGLPHEVYSQTQFAFQRLTHEGRKSIVKYAHTEFMEDLDSAVFQFIQQEYFIPPRSEFFEARLEYQCLNLRMKDSFHRMMAHSVCNFYNASSESRMNMNGVKEVVIKKPSSFILTPGSRLVPFLHHIEESGGSYKPSGRHFSRKPKKGSGKKRTKNRTNRVIQNRQNITFSNEIDW